MDLSAIWGEAEARYEMLAQIRPLKTRYLYDVYERIFAWLPDHPHVLELGIFKGGSLALWNEALSPGRLAGVDVGNPPVDSPLDAYLAAAGAETRVTTRWRTRQGDAAALRRIVEEDLAGRVDLVIDDASHVFGPTKASMDVLLPLVRPGGLYVVEDWGTDRKAEYHDDAGTMLDLFSGLARGVRDAQRGLLEASATGSCFWVRKMGSA